MSSTCDGTPVYGFDPIVTIAHGSLYSGNVINLFLYGALTVQLYLYHISFPGDHRLLKMVIYLVYAVETVQTVLISYYVDRFTPCPDSISDLVPGEVLSTAIPICGGIVASLTQAMYAYRIKALGRPKYIPWCIMVLMVLEVTAVTFCTPWLAFSIALLVWASVSLVIDIIIAIAMIWSLNQHEILSKQLKSKLTRLVYLVIGTGTLTAVTNLLTLILTAWGSTHFNAPSGLVHIVSGPATIFYTNSGVYIAYGPAIILSKFYANSMMVFLNDRVLTSPGRDDHPTVTIH